ncbi:MAG: hypothetical protein ACUZ8I_07795 [Candidatus Scalindua sp.]
MALNLSEGLRDGILDTSALNTLLDSGELRIYSGSAPSLANDTETGTRLVTISTVTGSGFVLKFQNTASSGVLSKQTNTWDGVAVATGTAGYFRYCASTSDAGGTSTTEVRIQGAVATSGSELNMSSTSITNGATTTIDTFDITMPAA